MFAGAMLVAMAVDAALGWPDRIYDRIGHPVTWIGDVIDRAERRFNSSALPFWRRRMNGVLVCLGIAAMAGLIAQLIVWSLPHGPWGAVLTGVFAWPLVAARSLHDHVRRVATLLARGDLQGARDAVAMIVGRDPATLDQAGVARAALESLAENASDGVVAPLFWGVVLGLPGIAAYKAINTMDSMIGHMSPRYRAFGWAAARLDDLVNLIPARLTAVLLVAVAGSGWKMALKVMIADAGHHRSPNAGWPEAAMAGALGIRLSGPRVYDGEVTSEPWVNEGAPDPGPIDLGRGLNLYLAAVLALALVIAVVALL
ncbi:cobalamin biosynthesis protein CobD [bacterium]|nr:cobalamin biosynthesis protein CobD [bacterium]